MPLINPNAVSRRYLWAQLFFWGGYFLLNVVFLGLWGSTSLFFNILFVLLSLTLGFTSHGLRALFKHYARDWSFLRIGLHLLWLLPLAALSTQLILWVIVSGVAKLFPSLTVGVKPTSLGNMLGYAINCCIMLGFWCALYLLRAEFYKRRNSEISYWQLQAQLKENELQFLRSQINSHFLFNAINNLRALIKEDPEAARTGLANLSILLRGLLQSDGQQLVSLRDELEWVRGYLALESLQFETRLHYSIAVDDALLNAKLPSLILQTLVENAIKHGIAGRPTGGSLAIKIIALDNNRWKMQVINPPAEFQSSHQGNKIGLQNARERLAIAYGNNAHLTLEMGDQVVATVEMPI